ncbi:MAG TPA: efflux RND transporter periplasmic adaptor subunit [Rudaea sp.]|nr:efflux RND transporter periplasmic adaptor subunit [Rudaea sp.]
MNTSLRPILLAAAIAALLAACGQNKPGAEAPRAVRTAELRYDVAGETNRYFGAVHARYEVDQAFRVGGKIVQRRVEVGQSVREGDVIAVLDDSDYRLAEEAARQQLIAATTQAKQAEADRRRLGALRLKGSVSTSDDEHAQSGEDKAKAAAEAETRNLELARNRLKYTTLRASQSGVVTAMRFEVGQVVAEGQPVVSIANPGEPEIVVDVPESQVTSFEKAHFTAALSATPEDSFALTLRELAPQAAAQTRTYRAKLKPASARSLPLGASATVSAQSAAGDAAIAVIPASAITQANGQPAVWAVRATRSMTAGSTSAGEATGTVDLIPITVHGYRSDEVLVSGPPAGARIVTAGVQKMSPGLRVALPDAAPRIDTQQLELAKQAAP